MASTTSRRGWASGRPPAAGVLVDLLVWLPKSLPGALFAAQTARHPAVTATVQPSAKAAQPTGSETGTKGPHPSRSQHKGAGYGWPHTSRAGHDRRTPGGLRRRPVRVAATCRSARPRAVLPARVDAGRPPQVDRADGGAPG